MAKLMEALKLITPFTRQNIDEYKRNKKAFNIIDI